MNQNIQKLLSNKKLIIKTRGGDISSIHEYNEQGLLIYEQFGENYWGRNDYDENGNKISDISSSGSSTEYIYENGLLIKEIIKPSSTLSYDIHYKYNEKNQEIRAEFPEFNVITEYDKKGRKVKQYMDDGYYTRLFCYVNENEQYSIIHEAENPTSYMIVEHVNNNGDVTYCKHTRDDIEFWMDYNEDGLPTKKRIPNGPVYIYEYQDREKSDLLMGDIVNITSGEYAGKKAVVTAKKDHSIVVELGDNQETVELVEGQYEKIKHDPKVKLSIRENN